MKRGFVCMVAILLTASACQTNPFQRNTSSPTVGDDGTFEEVPAEDQGLALSPDQRFADVPLPVGVSEEMDRTFVYESSSVQVGRMVYATKSSVSELVAFYLREAPLTNWELQSVVQADGAELVFTKPDKKLTVTVRDLGLTRGRRLILTLVPDQA